MAYQTPITIKDAILNIQKKKYVLPSIQREFVWETEQIEKLFDSLMRDYPISTFLFWQIDKAKIRDFQLYEFIREYNEKEHSHNKKMEFTNEDGVTAILDGQQRLTSLYIALKGTYAEKIPYYRWDNPDAFPKKKLYLNLLEKPDDDTLAYDFRFLSSDETSTTEGCFWFEVGKILEFTDISKPIEYLMELGLTDTSKYPQLQCQFALKTLNNLFNVVHQKGIISYYEEKGEELDKVLQIFIRVNSGGTKLSYSDLLLSIATAQWNVLDAREVIHSFVDELNDIGKGFNFNKDFVMKSCLVLGDFKDVGFKVDNFKKDNMLAIEKQWHKISHALKLAVELISSYGYNRDNLSSTNAVIPIAYYILKNNYDAKYLESSHTSPDRRVVFEWLVKTLLKKVFSGTPDSIYPVLRNIINDNLGGFPLVQIAEKYRGTNKSIIFNSDDLENMLEFQYGNALTYGLLALLYPGLSNQFNYHIDHIHPKKYFTDNSLKKAGFADETQREKMYHSYNKLSNLQLLQGKVNIEKNDKPLIKFFEENLTENERSTFATTHYFPYNVDLSLHSFLEFYDKRKIDLKAKLSKTLGVELLLNRES